MYIRRTRILYGEVRADTVQVRIHRVRVHVRAHVRAPAAEGPDVPIRIFIIQDLNCDSLNLESNTDFGGNYGIWECS